MPAIGAALTAAAAVRAMNVSHAGGGGVLARGLGGRGIQALPTIAPDMPLSGHILTFMLTCCTDLALVPPLLIMRRYKRHFEIYVGVMMLVSAFAYNFLNAMNRGDAEDKSWDFIVSEGDWHRISNVTSTVYICLLFIHLACINNEDVNMMLRYSAATLVLLAQVKDGFWMEETCYTIYVVASFGVGLFVRYALHWQVPVYWTSANLMRGLGLGALTGISFYFGLDDHHDEFRVAHGMSHLFGGLALAFLWKLVPRPKKKDEKVYSKSSAYV